jgi:hypothetical protein
MAACRRCWVAWARPAALAVALAILASARPPASAAPPALVMDASVGADLVDLAEETWEQFLEAFPARQGCVGAVRLRAQATLGARAAYDPATQAVTVRVPATRAMLESALLHEWAHHLEFHCPAHKALRPALLAAQRLPPDAPWRPETATSALSTGSWADTPSEQYAEAVVALVLGGRPVPTHAHLTPEAIRAVARWAAGE